MANHDDNPKVVFPEGFDTRWEIELPDKGYIDDVVIEFACGTRYALNFMDPTRLRQEFDLEMASGRPCFTVPNLVIVPEVTKITIQEVVHALLLEGFFEKLLPLNDGIVPHPSHL